MYLSGRFGVTVFFVFNDTATTEIYTLSLHDALPISPTGRMRPSCSAIRPFPTTAPVSRPSTRSEEHTSALQSHLNLVCSLLLEKKKQIHITFFSFKKKKKTHTQKKQN